VSLLAVNVQYRKVIRDVTLKFNLQQRTKPGVFQGTAHLEQILGDCQADYVDALSLLLSNTHNVTRKKHSYLDSFSS